MPADTSIYGLVGGGGQQRRAGPFAMLENIQSLRANQQILQNQQALLEQRQRALDDDEEIRKSVSRHMGPEGSEPDWDLVIRDLNTSGRASAATALHDKILEVRKEQLSQITTKISNNQQLFKLASQIAQGVKDEESWRTAKGRITELLGPSVGAMLGEEYDQAVVDQAIAQGRTATEYMQSVNDVFNRGQELLKNTNAIIKDERAWEVQKEKLLGDWTRQGSEMLSLTKSQSDWDGMLKLLEQGMTGIPPASRQAVLEKFGTTWSPAAVERARQLGMTQAERSAEKRDQQRIGIEYARLKDQDRVPELTEEALDIVAHQFAMTGNMVPLGIGTKSSEQRAKIINRAAELYAGLDVPTQMAAYGATKQALNARTVQLSAISAFEDTALKNLRVMLDAAKKIPDTGVPWVNEPLRLVNKKMLGSGDQAAFDAAQTVVTPEFARIIANPNLVGVLSDAARKEVQDINPASATFKQMVKVAEVLVQDAHNRRTSLEQEIAALQKRMQTPPVLRPGTAGSNSGLLPNALQYVEQGGQYFRIQTDAQGNIVSQSVATKEEFERVRKQLQNRR